MRHLLVGALLLLAPARAFAGGAFACTDACTRDPRNGRSCNDLGMGCNPITKICVVCSSDTHCAPGGTCLDGQCMGLVCTYDAGPDAGDTGTIAADAGDVLDSGDFDSGEVQDAASLDADLEDSAPSDARSPTDPLPGARGMSAPKDPFEEDKCSCTSTRNRGGGGAWILIVLLGILLQRAYRCGGGPSLERGTSL